jgi:putative ABC transport system ATP-binding protein
VAVVGKSGSGKSTLINMITGIDRPTSGQVLVGDTPVHTLKEGEMAVWRGRHIGVVFQFFQLLPTLTVAENVMLPMDFCNVYSMRDREEKAVHLLRQVAKTYETAAGTFYALKDVDLQVDTGEFVSVVGKSGSGKSTLINMITGIDRPTSGQVLVGDTAVHTLKEGQMAVWRGRHIGVVFQFFQLLPTLTVVENVMLPMDFCHVYSMWEREEQAMRLLEQVEMTDHAHKLPSAVSGGEQQRVAIARALANDPPIIVADEPTGNLDSKTAESVIRLFEDLVDEGKTILMVTHDRDLAKRATRTIVLSDGEVAELGQGVPAETMENVTNTQEWESA